MIARHLSLYDSVVERTQPVDFIVYQFLAGILEELLSKENKVLEYWTQRKKRLDQCHQYSVLDHSARQTLEGMREKIEYLTLHTNVGKNRVENEQLLDEHNTFKAGVKVRNAKFSLFSNDTIF